MSKYHGKSGLVYLSTSGAAAASSFANLSSWSLDMSTDNIEVTAFTDSNKVYVQGLKDISGSLSGFWDDALDTIFDAADSSTAIRMYLYPSSNAISKYWYGTAWLDMSVECAVDGAVTLSGDFIAAGAWGRK